MIYLGKDPVGIAVDVSIFNDIPKINDENAYIYVYLNDPDDLYVKVYISITNGECTIDWGDNTIEVINTSNPTHTYKSPGVYRIKLTQLSGRVLLGGAGNVWLLGGSSYPERTNQGKLIGLETGTFGISSSEFLNYSNIIVCYAGECTYLNYNQIIANSCRLLRKVELPKINQALTGYNFNECFNLNNITIPE